MTIEERPVTFFIDDDDSTRELCCGHINSLGFRISKVVPDLVFLFFFLIMPTTMYVCRVHNTEEEEDDGEDDGDRILLYDHQVQSTRCSIKQEQNSDQVEQIDGRGCEQISCRGVCVQEWIYYAELKDFNDTRKWRHLDLALINCRNRNSVTPMPEITDCNKSGKD